MKGLLIELKCPVHGFERFIIKVIKRTNIPSDEIIPVFRSRPIYDLSYIIIGRNVDDVLVQKYIIDYLRRKGLYDKMVKFKIL